MLNVLDDVYCTLQSMDGATLGGNLLTAIRIIYNGIRIGVPVLLVLFGMLDLGKAVIAQKEDEIKKGQQIFIKRLIAAVIVFFIFSIVKLVIGLISGSSNITADLDCIINEVGQQVVVGKN